ncbi:MAG: C13 family peptidase [Phenylobacterium sp.]|uniref:C13 family peptidase n=1 Tax=Phenylobacterium sp. TaxID=1871053 RepID=UPI00391BD4CF
MARARWAGLIAALAGAILGFAGPAAAGPFSDWAAVVVAGDWHAHSGGPSEAFDNARRDVSRALEAAGFERTNLRQFSVRPERYRDGPLKADPVRIYETLGQLTAQAPGGCLFYFTSHGAPQGVVLDQGLMPPGMLGAMLDRTCAGRPTVVVLSACFSGVFIPALARSNRMVLTAARPDRTSFGCGEADKYPYFDDCFLQSMRGAADFAALAGAVQSCVARREIAEGVRPPSEPQVFIGPALRPMLPLLSFASAPATTGACGAAPAAKAC